MTDSEIVQWLDYHDAAFPGFGTWLSRRDPAQRSQSMEFWKRGFANCSLPEAKSGTDKLYEQARQGDKKFFGDHVNAVIAIVRGNAQASKPRQVGGWMVVDGKKVWAYVCKYCQDVGFVYVWSDSALACYRSNPAIWTRNMIASSGHYPEDSGAAWCYHHFVLKCCCPLGQSHASSWCQNTFDPVRHMRKFTPENHENELDSLVNFASYQAAPRVENFDVTTFRFED